MIDWTIIMTHLETIRSFYLQRGQNRPFCNFLTFSFPTIHEDDTSAWPRLLARGIERLAGLVS